MRSFVLLSLLLAACSGEAASPAPVVAPEPTPVAPPAAVAPAPVDVVVAPAPEPTGTDAFYLGDEQPLTTLVRRWLSLPVSARAHGRIVLGAHNERGRLVVVETTAARSAELATLTTLAAEPLAALPEAVVTLAEFQATRSVNVHERPSAHVGALPRTIPHGGFGVELLGAVAGGTSSTEGEHPWVYVVVADAAPGWASGHMLGPVGTCARPSADAFLAGVAESDREAAASDVVVGTATLHHAGADRPVFYYIARAREVGRSHLAFFESVDCAPGAEIFRHTYPGEVNDFELPLTVRDGESLLLVGATPNDPPGLTYWTLHTFDADVPAWSEELMSDSVLAPEERILVTTPYDHGGRYEPIEIRYPDGRHTVIRWNDAHPVEEDL